MVSPNRFASLHAKYYARAAYNRLTDAYVSKAQGFPDNVRYLVREARRLWRLARTAEREATRPLPNAKSYDDRKGPYPF